MSTRNIKVRDVKSYSEGFNKGYQAAEANRKLTSITASIMKSVFYQDYHDSFYMGVADGWQHSFDQKKQQLKKEAKYQNHEPQKAQPAHNRTVQENSGKEQQQLTSQQRRQQRMQGIQRMQQGRDRGNEELER